MADGDLINFSTPFQNTPQTINLLTALPDVDNSVMIKGLGANLLTVRRAFNAATNFRIFNIPQGVSNNVAISGMTISNGRNSDFGGGILSLSNLTLTNVHLSGNQSGGGVGLGFADGVFTGCTRQLRTAAEFTIRATADTLCVLWAALSAAVTATVSLTSTTAAAATADWR